MKQRQIYVDNLNAQLVQQGVQLKFADENINLLQTLCTQLENENKFFQQYYHGSEKPLDSSKKF